MYRRLVVRHSARAQFGEVCEWLKQQVSKTCKPQGFEGSNPSLSVEFNPAYSGVFNFTLVLWLLTCSAKTPVSGLKTTG